MAAVAAAVLLACLASMQRAAGHGWMQEPMARNWYHAGQRTNGGANKFYGPMNLNRGGRLTNGAACGGEYATDTRFTVGGQFAKRNIVKTYKAGSTLKMDVQIWNNHWGYLQLRLCPLKDTSAKAEQTGLSEACFRKYRLKLNGKSTDKVWIYKGAPGNQFRVTATFRLPAGVKCSRCVLQWQYVTGHNCYLPGVDKAKMKQLQPGGSRDCPSNYESVSQLRPEKFYNCADIRIT